MRTLAEVVERIYANTKPEGGCLVTTRARYPKGYAAQKFRGKTTPAHRLVAQYYLGPCPEGQEVRHLCGRGHEGCVTASHLRYGTRSENVKDAVRHGTHKANRTYGRRPKNAKLSVEQVREICTINARGVGPREIARKFGVHRVNVHHLLAGRTYKDVP